MPSNQEEKKTEAPSSKPTVSQEFPNQGNVKHEDMRAYVKQFKEYLQN